MSEDELSELRANMTYALKEGLKGLTVAHQRRLDDEEKARRVRVRRNYGGGVVRKKQVSIVVSTLYPATSGGARPVSTFRAHTHGGGP